MRRAMQIIISPTDENGIHVRVAVLKYPEGSPAKYDRQVFAGDVSGVESDIEDADVRLWINRVVRLVARTLEDDLYESMRVAPRVPDARGRYPYKDLAGRFWRK